MGSARTCSNVLTWNRHYSPYLLPRPCGRNARTGARQSPADRFERTAQTRYRQADEPCSVDVASDGSLKVHFQTPQRAVTPGQSVVLYQGDECLGGAVIARTDAPLERQLAEQAA